MNQSTPFNALFPVFLKPDKVRILIVGGGKTGYEKLYFILKNSPFALISLVAPEIIDKIRELAEPFENVSLVNREFLPEDLKDAGILILATGKHELNQHIRRLAVQRHILTNVADTPELCDFYLGAIVTKGGRLTDAGNSVLVIEHNLDVIKTADYIIDLGPEGGDEGGYIVAEGTPERIARSGTYTGEFLKRVSNGY